MHIKKRIEHSQQFTALELWFLFSKYSPTVIIGLPDPTLGFLTNDIQEISNQVQKSLIAKKIVEPEYNQGWKIREPIDKWVRDIAAPTHTILIVRRNRNKPETTFSYHFSQRQVIGLFEHEKGHYSIDPASNPQLIVELLMEPMMANIYIERDESSIEISSKDFEEIRVRIENGNIAEAMKLASPLMEDEKFDRLAKTISDPVTRFSVLTFLNRNQKERQETKGFSVMAGEDDIWLFRAKGRELRKIQITSILKPELEDTIKRFIPTQETTI